MAEKYPQDETDAATFSYIHNRAIDVIRKLNSGHSANDSRLRCVQYYQTQSQLNLSERPVVVKVQLSTDHPVHSKWTTQISSAVDQINMAAPGLVLNISSSDYSKIKIRGQSDDQSSCRGSIFQYDDVVISLGDGHPFSKRTVVHELLHALGFEHEHKRSDAGVIIDNKVPRSDPWYPDFSTDSHVLALTRYDVFSIMHYPEGDNLVRKPENDTAWKLKPVSTYNEELSELDKVSLNLVFPPWTNSDYEPKQVSRNTLFYCGRRVMWNNNRPCLTNTDEICGPTRGPNCPACRVLRTDMIDDVIRTERWQGWSGWVYCGKKWPRFESIPGHDGFCGPNNGVPCEECFYILCPNQTYELQFK